MAIVKLGPIVAGISGKVGTVVFANAKQALVLRPTPRTRRKSSDFLLASQARMSRIRRHWATLTAAQQNRWRTAAANLSSTSRIGQTRPRTGFQYFVLTNKTVLTKPAAILENPSSLLTFDSPINPSVVFSLAGGLDISVDNPISPAFLSLQVYGWPFWVSHDTNALPRLIFLNDVRANTDPVSIDVISDWEEHFGPGQVGQRYAIGIKAWTAFNPFNPTFIFRGAVVA